MATVSSIDADPFTAPKRTRLSAVARLVAHLGLIALGAALWASLTSQAWSADSAARLEAVTADPPATAAP